MPSWYVEKGVNVMDGAKALAYSRERYAYASGDRHRVLNQLIIKRILIPFKIFFNIKSLLYKGQKLDINLVTQSAKALAYSRERYAYASGDRHRVLYKY